jgi:uncharacterized repeat protein (TIGR01451 family)
VVLSGLVPAGVDSGLVLSPVGAWCDASFVCTIGDLPPGAPLSFAVSGVVAPSFSGTSIVNTAEVDTTTADPVTENDQASSAVTVTQSADVQVTATPNDASVRAGEAMGWTVTVRNNGPSTAHNVALSHVMPAELVPGTIDPVDGGTCNPAFVCTIGDLDPGATRRFQVSSVVPPSFSGSSIVNTAEVASAADPTSTNDKLSSAITVTQSADLSIDKTGPAGPVSAGEPISWTLEVGNTGPSTAFNVVISDVVPVEVSGVTVTSPTTTCVALPCTLAELAPGDAATLVVSGVLDPAYADVTMSNTATVASDTPDPDPANDSDTADTDTVHSADLAVTQTAQTEVAPEATIVWDIEVTNSGPATARDVELTDQLPTGVVVDTAVASQGTCPLPAPGADLVCALGVIDPGAAPVTITVTATVNPDVQGSLTNVAIATSPDETDATDNEDEVVVPVTPAADLGMTVAPDGVLVAGTPAGWTFTVTNAGPGTASGAIATISLPEGVTDPRVTDRDAPPTPISAARASRPAAVAATCTIVNGSITCPLDDLPAGASIAFAVTATIGPAVRGELAVGASIGSPLLDLRLGDNLVGSVSPVTAQAELSVTVTAADAEVTVGESTVYTVTVTNAGPSTATGVAVSGLLPAGAVVLNSSSGDFDTSTGVWSVGGLDPGKRRPA